MGDQQADFARALEALAGRGPWPSDLDPRLRGTVQRFFDRAAAISREPAVPRDFARRALSAFRKVRRPAADLPSLLRVVFDSWFEPAPAVRRTGPAPARFLRYEGPWRLELQTRESDAGVELFGQLDPPDAVREVVLESEGKERRVAVDAVGSFRVARLRHGLARLRLGDATIEDIPL